MPKVPLKNSRVTQMNMRFLRQSDVYEAVMVDLALLGGIPKETCEILTGRKFPEYITLPEGALPEAPETPAVE